MNEIEKVFNHYDYSRIEHLDSVTKESILYFFNHVKCDEIGASSMPIIDKFTVDISYYRVSSINSCTSSVLISINPDSSSESFLTRLIYIGLPVAEVPPITNS